jgi:selenocysteine lyase/cysteine desulfurase
VSSEDAISQLVDPDEFPGSRNHAYLDAANIALMYQGAHRAIVDWQNEVAGSGSLLFDEAAEANVFDGLHRAAARLFNAEPEDIAVGSGATELLGSLAWAVAPAAATNVVGTALAFPSTIYPWQRVAARSGAQIRLAREHAGHVRLDEILGLIDEDTAVVCISHVEYGGGQRFDLTRLAEAAHDHGALLVVDATQSAGAIPIDAPADALDAVVCAGYKWLCGPFGAGIMYLAPHLQAELVPGLVGFRSHRDMWDLRADRVDYPATARRFEFSTMAYGCALGLARSIEFLLDAGVERIFEYNRHLADLLIEGLRERDAEITSPLNDAERTAIVTARFPGVDPVEIASKLKEARVVASSRSDGIRFSPHLYNSEADIERSLECIDEMR